MVQFGGGIEHTTPPLFEVAATQAVPPYEAVHGLLPEQATILEPESEMSIVDSELIMVAEVALLTMYRSFP